MVVKEKAVLAMAEKTLTEVILVVALEILAEAAILVVADETLMAKASLVAKRFWSWRKWNRELATIYEDLLQLQGGWTHKKHVS